MEQEEVRHRNLIQPFPPCPSQFLEINCTSSGIIRRFSVGTEAGFALQCINQKLVSGEPSASYIEAVKEGEEPISFGPNSLLVDYGDGWTLQTVLKNDFGRQKGLTDPFEEFPNIDEPIREDVQSATDLEFHLPDVTLPEENKTVTSGNVSDIDCQSLVRLDCTEMFTTENIFESRDELLKWARDAGRDIGMVIVIKSSEIGGLGRRTRINLACERFGQRREYRRPTTMNTPARKRDSRRCNCPFLLRGIKMPQDDQWKVKVECGQHNHPMGRPLQGSSMAGKLTCEEKEIVVQMLRDGMKSRDILKVLKDRDEKNESTIKTIYNTKARLRLEEMSARSQCNSS